jgi:sugar lactone lactonase YvrE
MISFAIGLVLSALISGDVLIISGGNLAHISLETGTVTPSVGVLHTYPNDVVIHDGSAFVVNSGVNSGTLQKFELNSWTLTELGIGTGWNCWASIPLSSGNLAVSATLHNSLEIVNPGTMQIVSSITGIGPNPEWMYSEGDLLYAACGGWGTGNSVVVADITTGLPIDTITVETNCQSVASDGNGHLFVTCSGTYGNNEGAVVVVDVSTGTATDTLEVGGFPAFSAAANGVLYTSDPWGAGVYSINMNTLAVLHDSSNPFCSGGNGMTVDDNGYLWISDGMNNEVRVYDSGENLVHTYSVTSPAAVAVNGSYSGIHGSSCEPVVSLSVYPNPATSAVFVSGAAPEEQVTVFDITGRIAARTTTGDNGSASLDVSELNTGLYTVVCGSSVIRFTVASR